MTFTEYPKSLHYPKVATSILKYWDEEAIFERSISERRQHTANASAQRDVTFYEGPPSANGRPGIHHVMGRTLKDIFCRYWALKGHPVPRVAGWDTHGLPIELSVESSLGIRKEDIGKTISVEEFNQHCLKAVSTYLKDWEQLTHKMGYWVDMENPYLTCSSKYMESVWWLLALIAKKGYLKDGYSIQPYSPLAGTALSSHELNQPGCYKEVNDQSVVAQFPIQDPQKLFQSSHAEYFDDPKPHLPTYILAWTTTPWTLPANTALCVGKTISYLLISTQNPYNQEPIQVILAEECVSRYFSATKPVSYTILARFTGSALIGLTYKPLFSLVDPLPEGKIYEVISDSFVTTAEGTGIVHMAPCYGADDYRACKREGIASLHIVDEKGFYKSSLKNFANRAVKEAYHTAQTPKAKRPLDVDLIIHLKERGLAFKAEKYLHNYPHCWRTDAPILYMPVDSWFIKTTAIKDKLLALNKTINWYPKATGESRFGDWLEHVVDWNLSRSRYWGIPLPIWRSKDKTQTRYIGSLSELKNEIQKAVDAGLMQDNFLKDFEPQNLSDAHYQKFDLHRTVVDKVILCGENQEPLYRENDVIDVWFDSGAMPYACKHYPFSHKHIQNLPFPADFIAEGVDQTRGWFFSLHVIAALCFDSVAYKNVIANGLVLDKHGQKMSKRLGNTIDPFEVIDSWGADMVRWYMVSNAKPWENLKFDLTQLKESTKKFFDTLFHTYHFFALYANLDNYRADTSPLPPKTSLDAWILSELHSLIAKVRESLEQFDPTTATRHIQRFTMDKLSNWYVRLSRRRFWGKGMSEDKTQAYNTLYTCLKTLAGLTAPFAPMLAERLYLDLTIHQPNRKDSIHLTDFPTTNQELIHTSLEERINLARSITTLVLSLREKAKIRVRQPLGKIMIVKQSASKNLTDKERTSLEKMVCNETNIKTIEWLESDDAKLSKRIRANFPVLGSKLGKQTNTIAKKISQLSQADIHKLQNQQSVDLLQESGEIIYSLNAEDVIIGYADHKDQLFATQDDLSVALDTSLTQDLINEGITRELVNRIQNYRKDLDLHLSDHIHIYLWNVPALAPALADFTNYIKQETLATELIITDDKNQLLKMLQNHSLEYKNITFDNVDTLLSIKKA